MMENAIENMPQNVTLQDLTPIRVHPNMLSSRSLSGASLS